jgi:hypothetical protein
MEGEDRGLLGGERGPHLEGAGVSGLQPQGGAGGAWSKGRGGALPGGGALWQRPEPSGLFPVVNSTCSDFNHGSALHIAASNLCLGAAKCLLEHGANPALRVLSPGPSPIILFLPL